MDLIRWAIDRPVSVIVGIILLLMFGVIGLMSIPVQLTPTVDRPIVTVSTNWPGRTPQEIVDEITREQEERLKNVENLKAMRSSSREGAATITLEFYLGASIDRSLQEVSDALRQVPDYPAEVDEPTIQAAEGSAESPVAWIIYYLTPEGYAAHPEYDITTLFDALDKEVKPYIERIDGVAQVNIYGGRERELRVLLDPVQLAQRQLNFLNVLSALRAENRNATAGTIAEGKRDYRIRVVGQFETVDDVLNTIVAYREGRPVYVRDVGTAELGHQKQRGFVRSLGQPCIAMNVIRQNNANSMEVMRQLRERLEQVQATILPRLDPVVGPYLQLRQAYDETVYISSAIDLVQNNLWEGGILASIVLLLFLRSFLSTGVVAIAIPLSVIGTFLVLLLAGRTLNVISLAGLAFSVGMGIDNAIVVLENIHRRRQMGDPPMQAAYRGAREVWGAILASTLTNVAVFIPVLTIREEAGQLFKDISLAASASVFLSLLVSVTVVPVAAAHLLGVGSRRRKGRIRTAWEDLFGIARLCAFSVDRFAKWILWLMTGWRAWSLRPAIIVVMTTASLVGGWLLVPPLDYLPAGNQNLVFGFMLVPPGYSLQQQIEIGQRVEEKVMPYALARLEEPETVKALAPIRRMGPNKPFDPVPVRNFFVVGFNGGMFTGATSQDPERVIPIGDLLTSAMMGIPDAFGIARQTSIFGRSIGGGNTVNLEISGPSLPRVLQATSAMQNSANAAFGFGGTRPDPPNFNLAQQEWRIEVNQRGRELGLSSTDVGIAVRSLFDGAFVDDFRLGAETIDMVLLPATGKLAYKEQLASIPIATPSGRVVPLDSVVSITPAAAPQEIQRIEELPSVTLRITPPPGRPLEAVMAEVREKVIGPAEQAGLIDSSMRIRLEGTAAKLDEVKAALFGKPTAGGLGWLRKSGATLGAVILGAGLLGAAYALIRAARSRRRADPIAGLGYGAAGSIFLAAILAFLVVGIAWQPQLLGARLIWALLVTYLLMCSLYQSFVYPFVIMFSVPLAVIGGFAALRIVHTWSLAVETKAPQNLDVLTILGFIILIGIVVNNAILLVEQAMNFMKPSQFGDDRPPLPPLEAIAESVRTRVRPIFMSTLTSVFGTLPLVLYPGAGSEMYRGMGSVIIGGQLVSTVFTLLLVPLVFGLTVQMTQGLRAVLGFGAPTVLALGAATGSTEPRPAAFNGALASTMHPRIEPRS